MPGAPQGSRIGHQTVPRTHIGRDAVPRTPRSLRRNRRRLRLHERYVWDDAVARTPARINSKRVPGALIAVNWRDGDAGTTTRTGGSGSWSASLRRRRCATRRASTTGGRASVEHP